ncbi:LEUCINE CARBOXYL METHYLTRANSFERASE, putative [Babesia bigemina]|uniref:Leucine carboxyl methyltransferase 1 n=1 Tax=Babesia bigemina TaxID=5866 RepID=A0A061D7P7_BABBI|nr:LEUCINE CARBOXYL METHYLTRANSFERASE, putative [Babesia bigemina]CDR96568.1 LEUCINE CARBOXYL METHYLTRANSFERASE, putative [Babesia bigemina]|eukprot:XP_012768754.1 LEUCINE CARBOXYL METHYLTRANSFERASE, putative [Babesia bigemina]
MADERSIDAFDTSRHAVGCKWSAVQAGYVEDSYIGYFTDGKKHGPIHNMLHFLRINAIRQAISAFIEQFPDENVQLVNLGCGFDTLAFWVLQHYPKATCFDVDKPRQLKAKAALIRKAYPVMELLQEFDGDGDKIIDAKRYKMVPADLNNITEIEMLVSNYNFARDQPTVFLSECSLVYLDVEKSNKIIKFASSVSSGPSCFVYWEPEFGSELHGSIAYPTIESQIKRSWNETDCEKKANYIHDDAETLMHRYTELGWEKVAIMDMNTLYNVLITDEEKRRLRKLECLDEVEEIVIVCQHYVVGVCGTKPERMSKLFDTFTQTDAAKTIRTYTTEEVREMIRSGTLSEMQPASLSTGWLS